MHTMSMRQHQSEQARPGERAHRHVVRILCGVGRKKRLVGMLKLHVTLKMNIYVEEFPRAFRATNNLLFVKNMENAWPG